jgi:hypothetical protein
MLSLMPQQCSTGFIHLIFESLTFLIVFGAVRRLPEAVMSPPKS